MHSSITATLDSYGHLLPSFDEEGERAARMFDATWFLFKGDSHTALKRRPLAC